MAFAVVDPIAGKCVVSVADRQSQIRNQHFQDLSQQDVEIAMAGS